MMVVLVSGSGSGGRCGELLFYFSSVAAVFIACDRTTLKDHVSFLSESESCQQVQAKADNFPNVQER